jgi:hypothetical protein
MAGEAAAEGGAGIETTVFLGERVSIESMPDPCAQASRRMGKLDCISMDALFRATCRVVRPVVGELGRRDELVIADHYYLSVD